MKKNKMMRIASVLLVAVLLSTSVISGTFAKYTSTSEGSDTARVAKWSFNVENGNIVTSDDFTFDLFAQTIDSGKVADGTNELAIIAPGTTGSFEINLQNTSEVLAKYTITLTETNDGNIPLQYSVDNNTWVDSVEELTMTELTNVEINMGAPADHTIYWRWVFDGEISDAHDGQTNGTDTTLGTNSAAGSSATVVITATITVEQKD